MSKQEGEKVYHLTSGAGSPRTFIWKKVFPPIWAFLSFNSLMHLGIANSSIAVRKMKRFVTSHGICKAASLHVVMLIYAFNFDYA